MRDALAPEWGTAMRRRFCQNPLEPCPGAGDTELSKYVSMHILCSAGRIPAVARCVFRFSRGIPSRAADRWFRLHQRMTVTWTSHHEYNPYDTDEAPLCYRRPRG